MTCFKIFLRHYIYMYGIVLLIVTIRIPVNAENICTDNFGAKCYSLITDLSKSCNYNDAVEYCKRNGGTLLSKTTEEEEDFLRELYTKINYWSYWVSGYRYNEDWKYSSDNTSIPMTLIKKDSEPHKNCLAIKLLENELVPVTCDNNSRYICVYSGEECEQGLCYQISYAEGNFSEAIKECKEVGSNGHLVELRNQKQTFTLKDEELTFPWIWKQRDTSLENNQCEKYTFKPLKVMKYSCTNRFSFVCEYKAPVISNRMKSLEGAAFIPHLDITPTSSSYKQTTSDQIKIDSSDVPMPQSTKSGINMINEPVMPMSSTSTQENSTVENYISLESNNRQTTQLISILIAVLILIGIVILIILLVRIMRKNRQKKNEIIYLEPIVHSTKNTIHMRSGIRDLPDIPCDSDCSVRSSIFPEYEPLQKTDPEEPQQNIYTYID